MIVLTRHGNTLRTLVCSTHTCLYLTPTFMSLYFNKWDLFQYVHYETLWEPRNLGGRRVALYGRTVSVSNHHLHRQLLPKSATFPFDVWDPLLSFFDLTNRCSQTLLMMGCLPSGFQADGVFPKRLLRNTEKYISPDPLSELQSAVTTLTSSHFLLLRRCRDTWANHQCSTETMKVPLFRPLV